MRFCHFLRRLRPAQDAEERRRRWQKELEAVPILTHLGQVDADRLIALGQAFLAQKRFVVAGPGVTLTDRLCIRTALMASLPVLTKNLSHYATFYEVRFHADLFEGDAQWQDELGLVHEETDLLAGEAWEQGPVQFSVVDIDASGDWSGYNVVIHELAHKLDMASGEVNGTPPLSLNALSVWQQTLERAFQTLEQQYHEALEQEWGEATIQQRLPMDPYALTNRGEFFAVSSESFFTQPHRLAEALPHWYHCLQSYYGQDPRQRAPKPNQG
ncbi:M90 family metallopeptidase [Ferrimonas gelatinilytica]|uniref:Zinc-dependent peptidase n=1 Tax=Ferrimonas gelatinilytica TaxID=1255257 RepID=A0ABP9RX37_9GAMM